MELLSRLSSSHLWDVMTSLVKCYIFPSNGDCFSSMLTKFGVGKSTITNLKPVVCSGIMGKFQAENQSNTIGSLHGKHVAANKTQNSKVYTSASCFSRVSLSLPASGPQRHRFGVHSWLDPLDHLYLGHLDHQLLSVLVT